MERQRRWIDLICILPEEEQTISRIARIAKCNIITTRLNIIDLEKEGIVATRKEDQCRYTKLTEKGLKIQHHLLQIRQLLNEKSN